MTLELYEGKILRLHLPLHWWLELQRQPYDRKRRRRQR
jgi:hypothetical protein